MTSKLLAGLGAIFIAGSLFTSPVEAARLHHPKAKHHKVVVNKAQRNAVMAMIKSQAPSYGVPTWFALRIAKVESSYNPLARGKAGEYGVFQLKCATARGVGFRGNCSGLLNASTNVRYGLKHLSLAVKSSRGNLKLAASKHNGGLGRKRLVPRYVAMVF
jgi:soluble lytic murein transglycosylase-like protein